jgi:hypothetical protein
MPKEWCGMSEIKSRGELVHLGNPDARLPQYLSSVHKLGRKVVCVRLRPKNTIPTLPVHHISPAAILGSRTNVLDEVLPPVFDSPQFPELQYEAISVSSRQALNAGDVFFKQAPRRMIA